MWPFSIIVKFDFKYQVISSMYITQTCIWHKFQKNSRYKNDHRTFLNFCKWKKLKPCSMFPKSRAICTLVMSHFSLLELDFCCSLVIFYTIIGLDCNTLVWISLTTWA